MLGRTGAKGISLARLRMLAAVVTGVVVVDLITKFVVQRTFYPGHSIRVIGDFFRLTYIMNPGAAFGIHFGEYSRPVFLVLAILALLVLGAMYLATPATDRLRLYAIASICGGALGNLIDRIRSPRGVVDFLDFGLGDLRWPIFNAADIAVTIGAVLLAVSLWFEEREHAGG
ncbi:MAG: signal peptidase II [Gemmatimonadetes bacterium]|nr:signal peptidase II [Gemmatimonadota bacterium]